MSLAAIANLITITPYHKKGSHGTSLRRDVDPSSLINYGACRDITSGASQSLKERIRDNSSHSRPCGPVVVEVDHIFLRRCLSWCTKKWTLHRASPPPPSRANMSRFLGKQTPASKRCEWASLYTNPLENVCLAIEREKEGSILTLGVQGEIITKYRDSCASLYLVFIFIFLHSRRPLQTAICGMEWEKIRIFIIFCVDL